MAPQMVISNKGLLPFMEKPLSCISVNRKIGNLPDLAVLF
jgi:hypothetical protein